MNCSPLQNKMDLRWDEHGVLWVTPHAEVADTATMRQCRARLRQEINNAQSKSGPVRLLFDLRQCTIGLAQLQFTVRTLLKNEAYLQSVVERSAVLLPLNRATKALADVFLRMYTPVRPFSIEIDVSQAHAFVRV